MLEDVTHMCNSHIPGGSNKVLTLLYWILWCLLCQQLVPFFSSVSRLQGALARKILVTRHRWVARVLS